ncbi:NAD-dependent epimerase/dehydratase family protein [Methylocystis echinoides]|uniref:NAD-dependent epimerase/dehydratase family protein n=1 Tax=Methylocystis echinoides TaxID=29468 RepID=UPI00341C941A
MKVTIAGAGGYLGEHIVRAALAEGHDVVAIVRSGSSAKFPSSVRRLEGDLHEAAYVADALADCEAAIFAAGRNFKPDLPLDQYLAQNVELTKIFFNAISSSNPSARVIFTSSMSAMAGSLEPLVFNETSGRAHVCVARLNAYDRAKVACEQLAREAGAAGRNVVILNPGLMLGPGASVNSSVSSALLLQWFCLKRFPIMVACGGHSVCDVRDVARAHVAALTEGHGQYILGGENIDALQLYDLMSEQTGIRRPPRAPLWLVSALVTTLDAASALTFGWLRSPLHRDFVRSQPLFYWGSSDRATCELHYRRRPLTQTIRDTIADFVGRGLVPSDLRFAASITDENRDALLLFSELARSHIHRTHLLPRLPEILAACRQNHELAAALDTALSGACYDHARGRFHWTGDRPEAALGRLRRLLDYCYYASDEFRERMS